MIRSMFFSLGVFIVLWGGTFLLTDRILVQARSKTIDESPVWSAISTRTADNMHELSPPAWAPFGMMALGCVTMLYSISLPKKQG